MNKTEFGNKLRTARKRAGMTSDQLAELCFLNATYVRQIEIGKKVPSLPVLISFCNVLHVTPTYLLAEDLSFPVEEAVDPTERRTLEPKLQRFAKAMMNAAAELMETEEKRQS